MSRLDVIERWLQQHDDELLYDVDGATQGEDEPCRFTSLWQQHVTSGLYAEAERVLFGLVGSEELVPLRIALFGTAYVPEDGHTWVDVLPYLVHPGVGVMGRVEGTVLTVDPVVLAGTDVPLTVGGFVVQRGSTLLCWGTHSFPITLLPYATLTLQCGDDGLIRWSG